MARPKKHPAVTQTIRRALLDGGKIVGVYSHEGSPGGFNNDRISLTMESGKTVDIDCYSTGMAVRVKSAPKATPKAAVEIIKSADQIAEETEAEAHTLLEDARVAVEKAAAKLGLVHILKNGSGK